MTLLVDSVNSCLTALGYSADARAALWSVTRAKTFQPYLIPSIVQACTDRKVPITFTDAAIQALRAAIQSEQYPHARGYQCEGIDFLRANRSALLADEMGLGKSLQALLAHEAPRPLLVVAPRSLVRVWQDEIEKWRPDLTVQSSALGWPDRAETTIVTSHEIGKWAPGGAYPETHLIIDEAHLYKAYSAQRTKLVRNTARNVLSRGGSVHAMTGSPILNSPKELWSMLVLLRLHTKLYRGYKDFARQFGGKDDGLGYWEFNAARIEPGATDPLRPYILRRVKADVLTELPPKIYRTHYSTGPNVVRILDALPDDIREPEDLPPSTRVELAYAKHMGYRIQLAEQARQAPLVYFSAHRAPIEDCQQLPGWSTVHGGIGQIDRDRRIAAFQRGDLRALACTIQTAALGLTLTAAAHVTFIDRSFVPETNNQAEDRLHRIGQKDTVVVTDVVADHPIDRRVHEILRKKQAIIEGTTGKLISNTRQQLSDIVARLDRAVVNA